MIKSPHFTLCRITFTRHLHLLPEHLFFYNYILLSVATTCLAVISSPDGQASGSRRLFQQCLLAAFYSNAFPAIPSTLADEKEAEQLVSCSGQTHFISFSDLFSDSFLHRVAKHSLSFGRRHQAVSTTYKHCGLHHRSGTNFVVPCRKSIMIPRLYQILMTSRTATGLCFLSTIFFFLIRLPSTWVGFMAFTPSDNTTSVLYVLASQEYIDAYMYVLIMPVGLLTTFIIYICYAIIGIKITWTNILHHEHLQKSIGKATTAAAVSSFGAILIMTVIVLEQYFWEAWKINFLPTDWYTAVFGLGVCYNLSVHPWCLMVIFPDIRKQMFNFSYGLQPKRSTVMNVVQSSHFVRT